MRKIIASDIFGKTPALERLGKALDSEVDIIDPYDGKYMGFQTEEKAYDYFMANVGLNTYCGILQSRLGKTSSPACLIGFSVGASAIWQISASLSAESVTRAVCFYGSQVRHLLEINPSVVIDFVLPAYEPGFSVDELASGLSGKKNVVLYKTPYLHGFMNELSKNHSKAGYNEYIDWLRRWKTNRPTGNNASGRRRRCRKSTAAPTS